MAAGSPFCRARGALDKTGDPADRITAEAVRAYVCELDALGNKKSTILVRLEQLTEMAKVLGPHRDWRFIHRIAAKVRARQEPASTKRSRLVGADQLLALGIDLMERADEQPTPLGSAVFFRDGLIIALLALAAPAAAQSCRPHTWADLLCTGGSWNIVLPPTATKTHVTLEYGWPEPLNASLETYLTVHRPVLLARNGRWRAPVEDRLWVSSDGSPFTEAGHL